MSSAAAVAVHPSIMTRSSSGFDLTTKLDSTRRLDQHQLQLQPSTGHVSDPPSSDLSLRRHQLGVFRPASAPMREPYASTYTRAHHAEFSKDYATMSNQQRDAPSGAARNEVGTSVAPRDMKPDYLALGSSASVVKRRGGGVAVWQTAPDPERVMEDHKGETTQAHPPLSDYKATYSSPDRRVVGDDRTWSEQYVRSAMIPPYADPSPVSTDDGHKERYYPFNPSGYAVNNTFAFDPSIKKRQLARTMYSQTFLPPPSVTVPIMEEKDNGAERGGVSVSNGAIKNGDTMPNVHAANEGADMSPWANEGEYPYESMSRSQQLSSVRAPRAESIPTVPLQFPHAIASNASRKKRIEHSAFSRSILPPPTEGVGSEHLKLHLTLGRSESMKHLTTRDLHAGYHAAPRSYHAAHSHRVIPVATRVGSGVEERQEYNHLAKLRRSAPLDYTHEIAHAPRYISTTHLMHNDKEAERAERDGAADLDPAEAMRTVGSRGRMGGWIERNPRIEPSLDYGGLRNPYETSYERQARHAASVERRTKASGKSVAKAQSNGYVTNSFGGMVVPAPDHPNLLSHDDDSTPHTRAMSLEEHRERFKIHSHESFKHPTKYHAALLPAASASQINEAAPIQSSYAREHAEEPLAPLPIFKTFFHPADPTRQRTVQMKYTSEDLHPTVRRALEVKEAAPSKNWGGTNHPLQPLKLQL